MTMVFKKGIVSLAQGLIGRRNLVRVGRFISNEARLDTGNDMSRNGELIAQSVAIAQAQACTASAPIFDVGANLGIWTKSLLRMREENSTPVVVHLFEPTAGTYEVLTANLKSWGIGALTKANRMALSSQKGSAAFYSVGTGGGRNSLHQMADAEACEIETVELQTVDNYCSENGIDRLVMVKIDAEGHDFEVMQGAERMIMARAIDIIQFEYSWRWIEARRYLKDVFEYLTPADYCIGKLTPLGVEFYQDWHFELETFREANFIAVKSALRGRFPSVKWWNA